MTLGLPTDDELRQAAGLLIGLILVGRRFEDGTLLRAAHAFERCADWRS